MVAASWTPARTAGALRTTLFALAILAYLLVSAGNLTMLNPLLSLLAMLAVLVSLPACGWMARILSAVFLAAGSWMLWHKGVTVTEYIGSYGRMVHLLALFSIVPVLAEPVKLGGYGHAISAVLHGRVKSTFQLNVLATSLAYVYGSFMTMAALPIMLNSLGPTVQNYPIRDKVKFISVSTTYSHLLPMLWTPVSGVVGAILYGLNVDWWLIFPSMLALSVAALVVNWVLFPIIEGSRNAPAGTGKQNATGHAMQAMQAPAPLLMQMGIAILLLVVVIVVLEHWLRIGLVTVVSLVAIPFAFLWSALLRQGRRFAREAAQQMSVRLSRMADQFAIFLSTGFFATALNLSGSGQAVNTVFLQLRDALGTDGLLMAMPVLALSGSCLGLHPLASIALLADVLKPEVLGVTPTKLAVTLIGSTIITYMLGPFSGTLGLVRSLNGVSTVRQGWWNLPYAGAYFLLLVLTVFLL